MNFNQSRIKGSRWVLTSRWKINQRKVSFFLLHVNLNPSRKNGLWWVVPSRSSTHDQTGPWGPSLFNRRSMTWLWRWSWCIICSISWSSGWRCDDLLLQKKDLRRWCNDMTMGVLARMSSLSLIRVFNSKRNVTRKEKYSLLAPRFPARLLNPSSKWWHGK